MRGAPSKSRAHRDGRGKNVTGPRAWHAVRVACNEWGSVVVGMAGYRAKEARLIQPNTPRSKTKVRGEAGYLVGQLKQAREGSPKERRMAAQLAEEIRGLEERIADAEETTVGTKSLNNSSKAFAASPSNSSSDLGGPNSASGQRSSAKRKQMNAAKIRRCKPHHKLAV